MERFDFFEYQYQAKSFVAFDKDNPFSYLLPALAEEVGELQGIFAKNFRKHGTHTLKGEQLAEASSELGDILWNVAMFAEYIGYPLVWIAEDNIDKLQKRKEQGTIAAIQRRES